MMRGVTILVLLLGLAAGAVADTVYIRDVLYVPLRGGESSEHRILQLVKSGARLNRIADNEESGYSLVRTEGGVEGYLQTQYLVTEPIARVQLNAIQAKVAEAEAAHQRGLLRASELEDDLETLQADYETLQQRNEALSTELADITTLASNVIQIDERNDNLESANQQLQNEIDLVIAENQAMTRSRDQRWFLYGAGSVMLGLLFGFWVARRIYHHKQSSGWS